jgi:hypothetical protein
VSKILLRHNVIRFAVVRTDAGCCANQLWDEPLSDRCDWNSLGKINRRFTKSSSPFL